MTTITLVQNPMNGSDHPPALPHSGTDGSELKLTADLSEVIPIWKPVGSRLRTWSSFVFEATISGVVSHFGRSLAQRQRCSVDRGLGPCRDN